MRTQFQIISLILVVSALAVSTGFAQEKSPEELAKESEAKCVATEDEALTTDLIIEKVNAACDLLKEKGEDGFIDLQGKDSDFIFSGTYIWIHDLDGIMRMHPIKTALNGKQLVNLSDSNGKLFFAEMNQVCEDQGEGWVNYMWPKPGEQGPSPKISYVKSVQSGDDTFVVGCGTYDESIIEAIKNQ
jgi:hypothetical protein